ncbi:MAG: FecR family protein [Flavobacteriaceae bacterium]|nr:FecR family protein [Flavobacteriaceae bacterium]
MKNLDNISKWLNEEMSSEELNAFFQTDDYKLYKDIVEEAKDINLLSLNVDVALRDFKSRIEKSNKKKGKVISLKDSLVFKIAASFVLFFGLTYYIFSLNQHTVESHYAENKIYTLPDNSSVTLNAVSYIDYNKSSFIEDRTLKLHGEAYFDVKKGSSFNVKTLNGNIKVLGTKFNVKSRKNSFNVLCYEGTISVSYKKSEIILTKGEGVQLTMDGSFIKYLDDTATIPSWLKNESNFVQEPYYEVLAEFERQYNVKIISNSIDTNVLFSGGFNNNDFNSAIKSITLSLNINYVVKDNKIVLSK